MNEEIVLILLGLGVGMFSGLIGIGGGLLIIPALMFVYPALTGAEAFGIKVATGISAVQILFGSLAGSFQHARKRYLDLRFVLMLGTFTMLGSFVGGWTTDWYSEKTLKGIYVVVLGATLASSLYARQRRNQPAVPAEASAKPGTPQIHNLRSGLTLSVGVGYLAGLMGIGGAVLLIPLMVDYMKLPLRLAIGNSMGIILMAAIATTIGKWSIGLIELQPALLIATGALAGGFLGATLSHRLSERLLFWLLMGVIGLTLVRMLWALY